MRFLTTFDVIGTSILMKTLYSEEQVKIDDKSEVTSGRRPSMCSISSGGRRSSRANETIVVAFVERATVTVSRSVEVMCRGSSDESS